MIAKLYISAYNCYTNVPISQTFSSRFLRFFKIKKIEHVSATQAKSCHAMLQVTALISGIHSFVYCVMRVEKQRLYLTKKRQLVIWEKTVAFIQQKISANKLFEAPVFALDKTIRALTFCRKKFTVHHYKSTNRHCLNIFFKLFIFQVYMYVFDFSRRSKK